MIVRVEFDGQGRPVTYVDGELRAATFRNQGKADAYYGRPRRAPLRATRADRREYLAGYDSLADLGTGKAWGNWTPNKP